jgi:hypothetical protein
VTPRRFFSRSSTIIVTAIAAVASYEHQYDLSLRAHQTVLISRLMPFTIDALVMAAMLAIGDGRAKKGPARIVAGIGCVATLAANIADAHPDLLSRAWSAVPAGALILLAWILDTATAPATQVATSPATPVVVAAPAKVATTPRPRAKKAAPARAKAAAVAAANPDLRPGQVAELAGVARTTARRAVGALSTQPTLMEA